MTLLQIKPHFEKLGIQPSILVTQSTHPKDTAPGVILCNCDALGKYQGILAWDMTETSYGTEFK